MRLNRKWILVIALVLSMATAISGTLAYLTATDTATNTFTVGNVSIDLIEEDAWSNPDYQPALLPGVEIAKTPYIVNTGSTEAWMWMEIEMPADLYSVLEINWNTSGNKWTMVPPTDTSTDPVVVTMKYNEKVPAKGKTDEAFSKVSLPKELTTLPESLVASGTGTVDIVVTAFAIQDANFANVDAAIAAFGGEGGSGGGGNRPSVPVARVTTLSKSATLTNSEGDIILAANNTIDTTGSIMGFDVGEVPMDVLYQFEPTMTYEEAAASEYADWHADFVVSANQDIPAYGIGLAGYYEAWCSLNNDKWVMLASQDAITAGTEIRLVDTMGGGSITVSYEELCNYGNDGIGFLCGAVDFGGKTIGGTVVELIPAGTVITVELRLYEATGGSRDTETGEFVTAGTYTYTFN